MTEPPASDLTTLAALALTALPLPVIVLDEQMRVLFYNREAEVLPVPEVAPERARRCGELLRCVHALQEGACCGLTEHCEACLVRRSALEAMREQKTTHCRATLLRRSEAGEQELHLLVTAGGLLWRERRVAVLMLRDLPEMLVRAGLVPICAWCQRVRTDEQEWLSAHDYLSTHLPATHGMCPDCMARWQAEEQ